MAFDENLFYGMIAALGGLSATAGYLLGLRRFAARTRDELQAAELALQEARTAKEAAERALTDAKAASERDRAAKAAAESSLAENQRTSTQLADAKTAAERALADAKSAKLPPRGSPTITHTVLLDGVSNSGKSTLVHRLAFPCTEPESLRKITATQLAYRTRVLPICFVPPVDEIREDSEESVLHAQVLRDIAGEKPYEIINILKQLSMERDQPSERERHGAAIVVLVWDMADTSGSRARITKERLQLAYHNDYARHLIKHFVIFFNKLDLLSVPPERAQQLVDEERAHLDSITNFLGTDVVRTYLQGSALRGDGVIECQGAIYTALGLAAHFRDLEKDGKQP